MEKYIVRFDGTKTPPLTAIEIANKLKTGEIPLYSSEMAEVVSSSLGITKSFEFIYLDARYKKIIEDKANEHKKTQEAAERERIEKENLLTARTRPESTCLLELKDGETNRGVYLPAQIRNMFLNGAISGMAQFKHPNYPSQWFNCSELVSESKGHVGWEYYVTTLKISGGTSGMISYYTDKEVKDESFAMLAKLGSEGWELVDLVPIVTGAIGATGTGAALAFLKRKIT
jgi:hypothetical protein